MDNKSKTTTQDDLSDFFKIPVGIHWVGPDGTILRVNQSELDLLGYSREEFIGRNIADIHVDKEEAEKILQKVKSGSELQNYETKLRSKDGSVHKIVMNSDVYKDNGNFIHTRFFIREITGRRQNELSNALLGAIIDGSNDAIISKDLDGIITSWNSSAERLFGYSAREAIGRHITMLFPKDRLNEEPEIIGQIKKGKRVDHFETIRLHKDGTRLNISLTISPIQDSDGKIVGASKIARDITKRKQAEAKLRAMNKELQERTSSLLSYQDQLRSLASKLSKAEEQERQRLATELHDNLGQLLTMSKLKLDLLQKKEYPDSLDGDINELSDLISEANRYTRQLMSELKPPPALDQEEFGTAVAWLADKMKQHNLNVKIDDDKQSKPLDEEVRTVLLQSIRELLFNVVKHAGVEEATINLTRKNDQLQVEVIDKGKGFDIKRKDILPAEEGGFGLFNIKERMDLLGGDLMIHSEPGKGTVAKLLAPLKEDEEANSSALGEVKNKKEPGIPPAEEKQNAKIKVLLADDHKMMRKGIRNLIEEESDMVVVAEAADGNEAVNLAHETSPDVVIMDVDMPVMNGIEATRKILSAEIQAKIIGLSLHDREDVERAMKNAGASVYLLKNEAFETLCATIRSEAVVRKQE